MIKSIDELFDLVANRPTMKIAVASAEDTDILQIVEKAKQMGLADFILIGAKEKIMALATENNLELDVEIIDQADPAHAAALAVELVNSGEASAVMKGFLQTCTFLKAILNKEKGLNVTGLISQVSVYDKDNGMGLQFLTDCAINISPTLSQKRQLIDNVVDLAIKLGYEKPRVAILSALELIRDDMPDTIEAAALSKMAERGQIKNCYIDGPLALDNAVSPEAAAHKNIMGEVAGRADILIAPSIQVGNVLTKALTFFAKKKVVAAVVGASKPIVMTSRTDMFENKLLSVALAGYIASVSN